MAPRPVSRYVSRVRPFALATCLTLVAAELLVVVPRDASALTDFDPNGRGRKKPGKPASGGGTARPPRPPGGPKKPPKPEDEGAAAGVSSSTRSVLTRKEGMNRAALARRIAERRGDAHLAHLEGAAVRETIYTEDTTRRSAPVKLESTLEVHTSFGLLGRICVFTLRAAHDEVLRVTRDAELAEAVLGYLYCVLARSADRNSSICTWQTNAEKVGHTFARWALPMTWDFCEVSTAVNERGSAALSAAEVQSVLNALSFVTLTAPTDTCRADGALGELEVETGGVSTTYRSDSGCEPRLHQMARNWTGWR